MIVPDECAQGRTSDRPGPLTYHAMGEDVVALLDHLHVARAEGLNAPDIAWNQTPNAASFGPEMQRFSFLERP